VRDTYGWVRMTFLPDSGLLDIGAQRLEYRWIGPRPEAAPTLVLLHEGLGCVGMWGSFPEQLAAATGCGVFVYSRAGYGQSSPAILPRPLNYMTDEARDTLPPVLDAIGFRRGLLVGHSDGASIAAIYAGSHQDHRVRGLVLIAPHFICEDITNASIGALRKDFETGDLRPRLTRWHADVEATVRGWSDVWLGPDFRQWDISEYLAYIRVPVLIVQGKDDQYGTVRQIEIAQEECYCPVEVALLPGARHVPQREAPEENIRVVSEFIRRLLRIDCLGQQSAAR
jgi:pimeloyl-ACP methyl ester carboxylesterase